jgi:hypothetical protein
VIYVLVPLTVTRFLAASQCVKRAHRSGDGWLRRQHGGRLLEGEGLDDPAGEAAGPGDDSSDPAQHPAARIHQGAPWRIKMYPGASDFVGGIFEYCKNGVKMAWPHPPE